MTFIIVTGIPGSGKSTVIEGALKACQNLVAVNHGNMMLSQASLQNIDRDQLRKLPLDQQQKFGLEAAKKIALMQGVVLIDTHAFVKTPLGFCPGIPEGILKIFNPKAIVLIECSPSIIYERRQSDSNRKRDTETIEQIDYHQQISRSLLVASSATSGALFSVIRNQNSPEESSKQLIELIKSLISYKG